jgi:hypothetical protein
MKTALRHTFIFLGLAALAGAWPAIADQQVYKWVDANGRLTYSDTPPPETDKLSHAMLSVVQDRVSTYSPDKSLVEATAAFRRDAIAGKGLAIIQHDADRRAMLAAQRTNYDPCAANPMDPNCNGGGYYPGYPIVLGGALRPPPQQFRHPGGFPRSFAGVRGNLSR